MLFLIPALAEWKVENAVCSSISSLIAATKTKVGNYDSKKKNRIFMFSLDDRRLIAASHNRSPLEPSRNPTQSAVFESG